MIADDIWPNKGKGRSLEAKCVRKEGKCTCICIGCLYNECTAECVLSSPFLCASHTIPSILPPSLLPSFPPSLPYTVVYLSFQSVVLAPSVFTMYITLLTFSKTIQYSSNFLYFKMYLIFPGIIMDFILQATFFTAWVAIDARR